MAEITILLILAASRRVGEASPTLLDAANIKRIVISATASLRTFGVFVTLIFFCSADLIEILS